MYKIIIEKILRGFNEMRKFKVFEYEYDIREKHSELIFDGFKYDLYKFNKEESCWEKICACKSIRQGKEQAIHYYNLEKELNRK